MREMLTNSLVSLPTIVCLQPFNFDPNEKNKHKFMVQSLVVPDGGEVQFDQLVSCLQIYWKLKNEG